MIAASRSLEPEIEVEYRSRSQWARRFSEAWWAKRGYCFNCGSEDLTQMPPNTPARDFICDECAHPYELKAKAGGAFIRVVDGAYGAMMKRIAALETPTFLLMRYSREASVSDVTAIHRNFLTALAIQKRPPLAPTARRAGWVGCNILLDGIPPEGKIPVFADGRFLPKAIVQKKFGIVSALANKASEKLGWMAATLNQLHTLGKERFTLQEAYTLEPNLQALFPDNHHIRDKIRQQLQVLRDAGFIEFIGRGVYRFTQATDRK
jgi:type II restriction enzyme